MRGAARRHRHRLRPRRRDDGRGRREPARPGALPRRPARARPAGRRSRLPRRARASSSALHDVRPRRPAHRPRPPRPRRAPRRARRARAAARRRTSIAALRGQVPRPPASSRSAASRRRRRGCRTTLPADVPFPVLVKAREGFGSRHIYRAEDRAELEFFLGHTTVPSMVQAGAAPARSSRSTSSATSSGRCLNAIPRTMIESKGGESIKGMTIKDWELIEHGRARRRDAADLSGRRTSSASASRTARSAVTDVNPRFGGALPAAARGRQPLPGARARARGAASGPSRGSASSARAS